MFAKGIDSSPRYPLISHRLLGIDKRGGDLEGRCLTGLDHYVLGLLGDVQVTATAHVVMVGDLLGGEGAVKKRQLVQTTVIETRVPVPGADVSWTQFDGHCTIEIHVGREFAIEIDDKGSRSIGAIIHFRQVVP